MKKFNQYILLCLLIMMAVTISSCKDHNKSSYNNNNTPPSKQNNNVQNQKPPKVVVENIKSTFDFNGNGIDDYTDIVRGGQEEASRAPRYDGKFWSENGGYPPDDIGVCTDTIWRAFKEAGYDLREMVNRDIKRDLRSYPRVNGKPEPNIDFRRVKNLKSFFKKYAISLTTSISEKPENWQPGDIVVFGPRDFHIGICSDKRNEKGFPYIIHNMGQSEREEDFLREPIEAHFRFDGSKINKNILVRFK